MEQNSVMWPIPCVRITEDNIIKIHWLDLYRETRLTWMHQMTHHLKLELKDQNLIFYMIIIITINTVWSLQQ